MRRHRKLRAAKRLAGLGPSQISCAARIRQGRTLGQRHGKRYFGCVRGRFYVEQQLVNGWALIDGELNLLVVTSYRDSSERARKGLQEVAECLDAATDPDWNGRPPTDLFKAVTNSPAEGALAWRVIEHLSALYLRERAADVAEPPATAAG